MSTEPGPPRLAVVGAGPAGLAAALAAAGQGVRVTLVDAAEAPGGQFYRQPAAGLGARRPQALHHRWRTWRRLRDGLEQQVTAGLVTHLPDHHVWCVERHCEGDPRRFTVHALLGPDQETPVEVRADAVLLATGGYEKVLPFPGWTLPGVVTAGGAQAMLKGGLVVSGRTAVVAGTGPLLLPVATGLAAAGVTVAALVESADPRALVRRAGVLVGRADKLAEGAGYAVELLRRRVRTLVRHTVVEAHGDDRLEAVTVAALDDEGRVRSGTERRLVCDTLAVGHGMLPHTDLSEALGCRVEPGGTRVWVDDEQRTDVPGVWAAGETTGIGGAALSLAEGHIAGRSAAAHLLGRLPDPGEWAGAAKSRGMLREFFDVLDTVYVPPARWTEQVTDDTVVCRCEEVTAGAVREAVGELGAGDVRTVKLLTRAGMGWCQGRMCGPAVAGIAGCAEAVARRPFARPVPLGVLARAGETSEEGDGTP
ncbi:NAD(P)/FAD-dependent oxidoreductase [Streptomyces europaeiscabiei]|uniref:NAD(P)/FAD-dependent oxidoreductase n=1 Tax=Streptomyces europaeiscabiei TaxID=146819 RepID=A0ABU4NW12_9ACTN|nr:NAD(P)/FAD-dependent oxidoreductase [Streptomyces europaeiscabiei]MDX2527951.1 NAD(P)/FAD-dependent oxidoreductase [Streptomyces europaeiscabiei]MDX3547326.1 NAD(P)/FAD-dependent oxidoreductase [Streptomyces europaeiscabiei]MDX3551373.1 NAD(P)/FAD-dependent oxidoreductase [Streptomyces europaeiscabiei]MDX3706322.1 NAD(P)/FAD-dependent oxidoreductase [Streptomyces europaeiscabiei]